MQIEKKTIHFVSDNLKLVGWLYSPFPLNEYYGVLFVHGGGHYTESRYLRWQEYLANRGYSSFSFLCRGVGESEGQFAEGTLNKRLEDSERALKYFLQSGIVDSRGIALVGSSMGAHVMLRLAERHPKIKTLLIQSAAAYALEAEDKPLNEAFTNAISKPESWANSPVFSFLKNYKGKLGVVYGENDSVVPQGVKDKYKSLIKEGEYLELKDGAHKLLVPENEQERQAEEKLYEFSLNFLNKSFT